MSEKNFTDEEIKEAKLKTQLNDEELGFWGSIPPTNEDRRVVDFSKQGRQNITFEENTGRIGINKKFNSRVYIFNVINEEGNKSLLFVTSLRFLNRLKEFLPLKGKTLNVERTGEGFDTLYNLKNWSE